jgi:phospholipase D1/2
MLYREYEMALPINSAYTQRRLRGLHRNISILRHPPFKLQDLVYWSHHEKIIIIDQRIGFVGGIDICMGRYDTREHDLFESKPRSHPKSEVNHIRRMKPRRVGEVKAIFGGEDHYKRGENDEGDHLGGANPGVSSGDGHQGDSNTLKKGVTCWPGMDYSNPLERDFITVDKPEKSLIDRMKVPRMPWHDVHLKVVGGSACDLARHFIERWNGIKPSKRKLKFLLPRDEEECDPTFIRTGKPLIHRNVRTQILRSVGPWSQKTTVERSIEHAYEDVITNSKKFIYIENQFFITNCSEKSKQKEHSACLYHSNRI